MDTENCSLSVLEEPGKIVLGHYHSVLPLLSNEQPPKLYVLVSLLELFCPTWIWSLGHFTGGGDLVYHSPAPEPSPLSRSWISGWRSLEYKTLKCSSQVPMDASVFPLIDVFTVDSVDISGAPTGLGGRNTRWVTAGACPGGDAWGGEEWELDFYVGSPWGCILQENSTEGLRYFSCCSTNRFLFQSRSFFGSFLLRLGAPWFHNSFPVKAPTFHPYWMVIVCIPWRYDVTCKTPLLPRGLTWQTSGCKFWRLWLWYNEL